MNKNTLSRLTGIGLILVSLLLLAGCQPEEVLPVEAAPSNSALSEEAAAPVRVDPADRKFYNGWYAPSTDVSSEAALPANVDPADRKFYSGWYVPGTGISSDVAAPADIHPADRKFFIREYATNRPR